MVKYILILLLFSTNLNLLSQNNECKKNQFILKLIGENKLESYKKGEKSLEKSLDFFYFDFINYLLGYIGEDYNCIYELIGTPNSKENNICKYIISVDSIKIEYIEFHLGISHINLVQISDSMFFKKVYKEINCETVNQRCD